MTNNKVRSYAERIERLLDERAAIDADIKDIYTEVKSADLKPKVLRKAIANKRRKVDKQFEADVEEYAALLLALPGATYRSVAEQTGISKSRLQRRVPQSERGTSTPHDPETGEISESCGGTLSDRASQALEPTVSEGLPVPAVDDAGTASSVSQDASLTNVGCRCEPGPQDPNADGMDIPLHLRRTTERRAES